MILSVWVNLNFSVDTGTPIILGRWPSLPAHESESCYELISSAERNEREREREREREANGRWEKHTVY
jgi:hypothetical protein